MSEYGMRQKRAASEKLRIVLAGLQPNGEIAELCRREGINPTQYYGWKKQLLSSATKVFAGPEVKKSAFEGKKEPELRRSGTDIIKALALGAMAVGIGRPYAWGLALDGTEGVVHVLRCLLAEADLLMAIDGYPSRGEVGDSSHRLNKWDKSFFRRKLQPILGLRRFVPLRLRHTPQEAEKPKSGEPNTKYEP